MIVQIQGRIKKRKGFGMVDLVMYAVGVAILIGGIFYAIQNFTDGNRRTVAWQDLDMLISDVQLYIGYSSTATAPTDLGKIVTGLTAAQSIDQVAHTTEFQIKPTWTTDPNSFIDPWGNAYLYDAAARTITCTNNGGSPLVKHF